MPTTTTGTGYIFQAGRCYPQSEAPYINTGGTMGSDIYDNAEKTPQECYDYCVGAGNSGYNIMGLDLRPTGYSLTSSGPECMCNPPSVKARER